MTVHSCQLKLGARLVFLLTCSARYPEHLAVHYCTILLEALIFAITAVLREIGSNGDFTQISNVCTKYCVCAEYTSRDHDFPLMLPCPL